MMRGPTRGCSRVELTRPWLPGPTTGSWALWGAPTSASRRRPLFPCAGGLAKIWSAIGLVAGQAQADLPRVQRPRCALHRGHGCRLSRRGGMRPEPVDIPGLGRPRCGALAPRAAGLAGRWPLSRWQKLACGLACAKGSHLPGRKRADCTAHPAAHPPSCLPGCPAASHRCTHVPALSAHAPPNFGMAKPAA
jgi:hypothetical protein